MMDDVRDDNLIDAKDATLKADARPVCPQCLQPCEPGQYYCNKCGSTDAINPLTPYMGFVNLRYNYGTMGRLWYRIWDDSNTPEMMRLVGFLLVSFTAPILLPIWAILVVLGKGGGFPKGNLQRVLFVVGMITGFLLLAMWVIMIVRVLWPQQGYYTPMIPLR